MSLKDDFIPKEQVVNDTNIAAGKFSRTFRGQDLRQFTMQVNVKNVQVKIYCSNWKKPGTSGWVDLTTYFTGAANINSTSMVIQSTRLEFLWWKIEWQRTNATNSVRIELLQYGRKIER